MAKVLHAADFHLDSAFRSLPEEQARLRRQESRELPGRLVDWANDHGAQLMLLAGDLFDSDRLYSQTAQMLAQALARFQGAVVIAPGNHDWLSAASPYRQPIWPENVHIFLGRGMERLTLPELGCTVYGAAFAAPEEAEALRAACAGAEAVCASVTREQKKEAPPRLYDLTTLQR